LIGLGGYVSLFGALSMLFAVVARILLCLEFISAFKILRNAVSYPLFNLTYACQASFGSLLTVIDTLMLSRAESLASVVDNPKALESDINAVEFEIEISGVPKLWRQSIHRLQAAEPWIIPRRSAFARVAPKWGWKHRRMTSWNLLGASFKISCEISISIPLSRLNDNLAITLSFVSGPHFF